MRKGEIERALVDAEIAVQLDPEDPTAYCVRGQLRNARGETARAIEDFRHFVSIAEGKAVYAGMVERARQKLAELEKDHR